MKNQVEAYFLESKWFHEKYIPTMEEYMPLALATSGYKMLATAALVGMGDIVTEDSFKWLFSGPKMVTASQIIGRLINDIVTHKVRNEEKYASILNKICIYLFIYLFF